MTDTNMKLLNNETAGIEIPLENDVPLGRGGYINSHPGHRLYLKMVQDRQLRYVTCKKSDKTKIAWSIVRELRALDPPARFLQRDPATGQWNDVGDKKFREKVSQALREHQPFIKAVIDCEDSSNPEHSMMQSLSDEEMGTQHNFEGPRRVYSPASTSAYVSLNSEDRRQAFSETRMETSPNLCGEDEYPQCEEQGSSLGDFSVSQGPSFPSFNSIPQRRDAGRWEEMLLSASLNRKISIGCLDGLDFPESTSFHRLTSQDNSVCDVLEEGMGNQKIDWDASCWSRLGEMSDLPRPDIMKRASSNNNNETVETRRGFLAGGAVKRCLLNRDKSEVARKLKETYSPEKLKETYSPDEAEAYSPEVLADSSFPLGSGGDPDIETLLGALENSFLYP